MSASTVKQLTSVAVVFVFLVLLFRAAYPLTMGYLFPWEPPTAPNSPHGAVLRIIAPEEQPYRIAWGPSVMPPTIVSEVEAGETYNDHPVPVEAENDIGRGGVEAKVYRGRSESKAWEGELGAVLFVDGEYADCAAANEGRFFSADINSQLGTVSGAVTRMTCGAYRY